MFINSEFEIEKATEIVEIEELLEMFNKDMIAQYTSMENLNNEKINLKYEFVKCPICDGKILPGQLFPAAKRTVPVEVIDALYQNEQLEFGKPVNNKILINLDSFFGGVKSIKCPHCGNTIKQGVPGRCDKRSIVMFKEQDELFVKVEIMNMAELISAIISVSEKNVDIEEKMLNGIEHEVLKLDLNSGKAFLSVEGFDEKTLFEKDITTCFDRITNDPCFTIITCNKAVREFLINQLKNYWLIEFPFNEEIISFQDIIMMNRFKGYNANFYKSIPFKKGSYEIEESFEEVCESLQSFDAVKLFEQCSLPKTKCIRRSIYKNTEFLIYIEELESLFSCLNNIDLFCSILNYSTLNALILLRNMHSFPGISEFIRIRCSNNEGREITNLIKWNLNEFIEYCKNYALLNDHLKEIENCKTLSEIKNEFNEFFDEYRLSSLFRINEPYSLPFEIPEELKIEGRIDDFTFCFLKSTNEAKKTSLELNNCLNERNANEKNPVVLMKNNASKTVAAIEISRYGYRIEQALIKNNEPIEVLKYAYRVFKKWAKKNRLEYEEDF